MWIFRPQRVEADAESVDPGGRGCEKNVDVTRRLDPDADSVDYGGCDDGSGEDVALDVLVRPALPSCSVRATKRVRATGSVKGQPICRSLFNIWCKGCRSASSSTRAKKRVRATGSVKDLLLRRPPLKRPCKACRSAGLGDVSSGAVTSMSAGDDVVNAERCDLPPFSPPRPSTPTSSPPLPPPSTSRSVGDDVVDAERCD